MKGIPQSPVTVWFQWQMAYIFPILRPECPLCFERMRPFRRGVEGYLGYACPIHAWFPCDESLKEWGERNGK